MPKMAMHNDPMQRKEQYETQGTVPRPGHNEGRMARQQGNKATRQQGNKATKMSSRKDADQQSNLNNASKKPEWATGTGTENMAAGTSIFDPVLCELAYRWFCPKGGKILDPFAGGSVRGIVASKLDRHYLGIDLRSEQITANQEQALRLCSEPMPSWLVGDSINLSMLAKDYQADLIFSCPPYGDLEVYSDDPKDISTMAHDDFLLAYVEIIMQSIALLKEDRFACFVVGDFRDKKGFYRDFISSTIRAFTIAGAALYNEAILVTSLGSLPIRVGKSFTATRKLGKTHQQVLVFCKGDPRKATEACGVVEVTDIEKLIIDDRTE